MYYHLNLFLFLKYNNQQQPSSFFGFSYYGTGVYRYYWGYGFLIFPAIPFS